MLPKNSTTMPAITVFIERRTNMAHLLPYTNRITIKKCTNILINHIFKLRGLHKVIISDHDPQFLINFWDEMFAHLAKDP